MAMQKPVSLLKKADPHLAAVRSVAKALIDDGENKKIQAIGVQMEAARFKLFEALKVGEMAEAVGWHNALEAASGSVLGASPPCLSARQEDALRVALVRLKEIVS